jgi:putative endonuclease
MQTAEHNYWVYLLTDKARTTLYVGVTSDLQKRLWEHRNPENASFTQAYHCVVLVYWEHFRDVREAIAREKQLKGWRRAKKDALVEKMNPNWEDLGNSVLEGGQWS